jgi:hypothetical protein
VIHHGYSPEDESVRLLYDLKQDKYQLHPEKIENPFKHRIAEDLERKLRHWLKDMKDPFYYKLEEHCK